ncbi:MAG: alpha/beta hydrolase [Actinobacteria bacterium]|nr:MAG: alpha/beta hydrolase [Actinomycetota bacterium]
MATTVITNEEAATRSGNYIDVDGVRTYYEVTGTGEPVILLHGGLCAAETFDAQTTALAEHYRVYVPERYGHGRTPDINGAITYENMAQHTIAFMEALGIESAHLAGWSDGALVGLLVALRRPKLVRKLVLIDQFVSLDAARPGYLPFMTSMSADNVPAFVVEIYRAFSPDGPDHFHVVFDKLHKIWLDETGIDLTDLQHVAAPTLVLVGDDGCMRMEQVAAMHRALPDSQLAVVPGTSHGLLMEKPHVVNQLIVDFLADEQVPKMFALDDH